MLHILQVPIFFKSFMMGNSIEDNDDDSSLSPLEDSLSFIMAWLTCSMISLLLVGSPTFYCSWQILDFLQGIYLITWPAVFKITLQLLWMFSVEILFTLCWKRTIHGRKVVFILGNVEFGNNGFTRYKFYMLLVADPHVACDKFVFDSVIIIYN